jgi:hypothetical protein
MFEELLHVSRFAGNAGIQYDAHSQIAIAALNLLMKE